MNVAEPLLQAPVLTDAEHGRQLRRAVIASTIGTTIEWYDFFVYGTVTALAFGKLFFPRANPLVGTLEAFSVYAVGFFSRPIGAAIFGPWGDRFGRKSALIVTLMLMGIATFLVGLVPTYARIGIWGAVILTTLRCLQGTSRGRRHLGRLWCCCRWNGRAPTNIAGSWPRGHGSACPTDLFLSSISPVVLSRSARRPERRFSPGAVGASRSCCRSSWWRSACGSVSALPRHPCSASCSRSDGPRDGAVSPCSSASSGRKSPSKAFGACGRRMPRSTSSRPSCSRSACSVDAALSRDMLLFSVLATSVLSFVTILLSGHLSDRCGRKRVYLISCIATGIVSWILFCAAEHAHAGVDLRSSRSYFLSLIPHDIPHGGRKQLTVMRRFTPRMRYSGASIGYQLTSIIAGGPAPLIRHSAAQGLSHLGRNRRLHHAVLGRQFHRDADDEGLHQQGYLERVRPVARRK